MNGLASGGRENTSFIVVGEKAEHGSIGVCGMVGLLVGKWNCSHVIASVFPMMTTEKRDGRVYEILRGEAMK